MSNVLLFHTSIIWDLSVAGSVSLIRMLGYILKQNHVHYRCDFCTIVCSSLIRNEKNSHENNIYLLFGSCNTDIKGNLLQKKEPKQGFWLVSNQEMS